ncbi:PilZ domain-containing protein [Megalodesulfovibrio paquesii]
MKLHCPRCESLLTVPPAALSGAGAFRCPHCATALTRETPDAALVDCSCGFRRAVGLEHAQRSAVCPVCGRVVQLVAYKLPRTGPTPPSQPASGERRCTARHQVRDLAAYLGCHAGAVPVHNISPVGICLDLDQSEAELTQGQLLVLELLFRNESLMRQVRARVVRCDFLSAGCIFVLDSADQKAKLREVIRDCVTNLRPRVRVQDLLPPS